MTILRVALSDWNEIPLYLNRNPKSSIVRSASPPSFSRRLLLARRLSSAFENSIRLLSVNFRRVKIAPFNWKLNWISSLIRLTSVVSIRLTRASRFRLSGPRSSTGVSNKYIWTPRTLRSRERTGEKQREILQPSCRQSRNSINNRSHLGYRNWDDCLLRAEAYKAAEMWEKVSDANCNLSHRHEVNFNDIQWQDLEFAPRHKVF